MLAILYALRKLAIDLLITGLHHKYARILFSEGTTVARGSIQNDVTTAWRRQW
jgi:hypothetical protein